MTLSEKSKFALEFAAVTTVVVAAVTAACNITGYNPYDVPQTNAHTTEITDINPPAQP